MIVARQFGSLPVNDLGVLQWHVCCVWLTRHWQGKHVCIVCGCQEIGRVKLCCIWLPRKLGEMSVCMHTDEGVWFPRKDQKVCACGAWLPRKSGNEGQEMKLLIYLQCLI